MRWQEIAREAIRNVATGTSGALWIALGTAAITSALALTDASAIAGISARANLFRESGATTYIAVSADQISGKICDSLSSVPGVVASGGVRAADHRIRANNLPDQDIELFEASPGLQVLLHSLPDKRIATSALPQLAVEQQLAIRLGLRPGDFFYTDHGAAFLGETFTFPDDGRTPLLSNAAVLVDASSRYYDQCWMKLDSTLPHARELVSRSVVPNSDEESQVEVTQLNSTLGTTFDRQEAFENRPTRFAAGAAAALAALFAGLFARHRRIEFANARHFGVGPAQLMLQTWIETALWSIPTAVILIPALTLIAKSADTIAPAHVVLAGIAGAGAATSVCAAMASEKKLFRDVKER